MRGLANRAGVSLGITVKIVNASDSSGHIEKKSVVIVKNWRKLLSEIVSIEIKYYFDEAVSKGMIWAINKIARNL